MSNAVPQPRHPFWDLLARYRAVLSAAWAARHELAGPRRLADELAFLPARLSLQETPVHPAPRRAIWAITALFGIALAWSWFGKVDIVAVAEGQIVVSDRTKIVQPLEAAVVKAIRVRDGDKVQAGQVLIELDPTEAQADSRSVQQQLQAAAAEAARAKALLAALAAGSLPAGAPSQTQAEWLDMRSRADRLDAELQRRRAELATVQQQLAKLQTLLPLLRQREMDFRALAEQGFMSSHAGQDRERERIEVERDLATAQARLREAEAAVEESVKSRAALSAEAQRSLSDRLLKVELEVAQLGQQGAKAAVRQQLTQLTAPVSGTVQQLAVHTTGGVVTPAQPLMVIVPAQAEVMAEVSILNKDIGSVSVGQQAEIKLDAFVFTQFGTVPAVVRQISADAVIDEQGRPLFKARLELERTILEAGNLSKLRVIPGLKLTAEVITGERRVIAFLVDPLRQIADESLRER